MNRFTYDSTEGLVKLYNKDKVENIVGFIVGSQDKIISNLNESSIAVYDFLAKEYSKGEIKYNLIFQFVFSSFYGLNNAGLIPEFKEVYFKLLDKNRDSSDLDFNPILNQLLEIENRKGQKSLQFSFTTKLFHTIDPNYPIYDAEIASLFDFRQPYHQKDINKKIKAYLDQYSQIKYTYDVLVSEKLIDSAIDLFQSRFSNYNIPLIKIIDFIFWSSGKLKKRSAAI